MFRKKKLNALVRVEIDFQPTISRLFIFRCLWVPVIILPMTICALWFGVLSFVHFFTMLVLGERNKSIFLRQLRCINFMSRWQAYLKYFSNERPAVLPWKA